MKDLLLKARQLQAKGSNRFKTIFVHKDGPVIESSVLAFHQEKPTVGWFRLLRTYQNPEGSLIKVK